MLQFNKLYFYTYPIIILSLMAQIFIKIDKPFYFAGETIVGQVYFCLYEPMNANQVLIKFKGWQQARWIDQREIINQQERNNIGAHLIWTQEPYLKMQTTDSSSEQQKYEEFSKYSYVKVGNSVRQIFKRSGGKLIVKTTNLLHNFGGQFIPPGQYVLPFSYKTAQNYPASYTNKAADRKSKGRIKYEMRVFVRGFNSHRRLIKHRTEIVIRETSIIKNQKQQMEAHVKSCCCIDKGVCKIQCFFEKNGYMPGQQAKIFCILNNKASLADITSVTVQLINEITYTSKDNYTKKMKHVLFTNQFPGLEQGGEAERDKTVLILNSSKPNCNPADIMPTARGQRVKSVYFLRVEAVLNASCTCCSDLPVVSQPIVIYPYISVDYFFKQPSNWNPIQMDMIDLQRAVNVTNKNLDNMNNPYY